MTTSPSQLILASTSPYRRALLDRLDIAYTCVSPVCDESPRADLSPQAFAMALAEEKARSVHQNGALVIGSDQVVNLHGQILGKPGNRERAIEQLSQMAGRDHQLITAVAVHNCDTAEVQTACDIHHLWMRPLSQELIRAYVSHDQPFDCAGSYKLEQRGIALFDRIEADPETADASAIMGLPVAKLLRLLREMGYELLAQPPP